MISETPPFIRCGARYEVNRSREGNLPDRVSLVGCCRRDATLYAPPSASGRRHRDLLPTPEEISKDSSYPSSTGKFFYGGDQRDLKYKAVPHPVIWLFDKYHVGVLCLIVLMPIRYLGPSGKYHYNAYYYVLTNRSEKIFDTLPRWRKDLERSGAARRGLSEKLPPVLHPSVQDLLRLLRKELLFRWVTGKTCRK
jgi:hypothetical protein